ncbi:NAD dependent epimerase/dehydratase [Colletotrichum orchidophilum]|uniref:NAD dependent epimerase/dehydratase n=1 Tax=Colletotrichum orchidophilum TaxID=1209926 RepID=A0A1G4AWM0_9PEZI|nr:NAD dependent epimerase/dehydratase [Colletotrichum orchidophilum]OHE93560.1 NAD dependent epimerase/dehydratase [Colletotrichum orchidophilum]
MAGKPVPSLQNILWRIPVDEQRKRSWSYACHDDTFHTASTFNFRKGNSNTDFFDPAVKGTTEILRGVVRKGAQQEEYRRLELHDLPKRLRRRRRGHLSPIPSPDFDVTTVCRPMVYGQLHGTPVTKSLQDLNESNFMLYQSPCGRELTSASSVPPEMLDLYVDVRDVARAHLLAAMAPDAGGKRDRMSPGGASNQQLAHI